MATRLIFEDENSEMECYLNDKGKVFSSVTVPEDKNFNGFITLDKQDVNELISLLQDLEEQMEN